MDAKKLKLHLNVALNNHEIRMACAAVERLHSAIDLLDNLSEAALDEVRDYCIEYNKGRKGAFSEFKRSYIALVAEHLNDLRLRKRRLYYGITGKMEGEEES